MAALHCKQKENIPILACLAFIQQQACIEEPRPFSLPSMSQLSHGSEAAFCGSDDSLDRHAAQHEATVLQMKEGSNSIQYLYSW